MTKERENKLVQRGYVVTGRCTDGSPTMQMSLGDGIWHVIFGDEVNDYYYAEYEERPKQLFSYEDALYYSKTGELSLDKTKLFGMV